MKAIERFNKEKMKKEISSGANGEEAFSESYVGSFIIGKEFVTKKKVVKKTCSET